MKKNAKIYTFALLVFLCVLSLSGSLSGIAAEITYVLAFLLPLMTAAFLRRGEIKDTKALLRLKKEDAALVLPTLFPLIALIFSLSYLTALLLFNVTGKENPTPISGSLSADIFTLALLPAILEETLFRYLPLTLIAPYSKKSALLISTLFFAFAHTSLFSIPYAAFAGFAFMLIDLVTESLIPSVILHLINNSVSVILAYTDGQPQEAYFTAALFAAAALSVIPIVIMKKKYSDRIERCFSKEDKTELPAFSAAFILPTLTIAILDLI